MKGIIKTKKAHKKPRILDIKSVYIFKRIFINIKEKNKLDMIKYNKKIQNLLGIDINNYKELSGKYKIDGINSYGKEYILNTNILLFEGEYLNKKRNGEGKEYNYFGELIYEGGYINGKRERWGLEYDDKGELIFEGEYKNGKRWIGYGKENTIDFDGTLLTFEGEYKNGKIWKGIEYESRTVININLYEDYIIKFKGEYFNGKRWNGFGYDSKGNYLYTLKSGNGKVEAKFKLIQDGCNFIYKGEFINGESICKHSIYGYLRPYNQQIKLFEGEYLNGKIKNGKWYDENGIIECEIKNGNGKGKEYYKNKSLIKGPYDDNEYHSLYILFEGEYLNGERNGKGKEYYSPEEEYDYKKGVKFKGEYLNGKRNGKGKEFYENGALKFEGEYFNGERWNGYEICYFDKYTNNYNHQTDNYNIEYYEIGDYTIEFEEIQDNIIKFEIEYLNGKKWNVISYNEYGDYRFDLINGKGKIIEYDYIDNDIDYKRYVAEYLNGKKNGKGVEYYRQICYPHCSCHIFCGLYNLVFKGEYLNGKKHKGIEYTYNDESCD